MLCSLQIKFKKKITNKREHHALLWIYSIRVFVSMVVLVFRILIRKSSHIRMRRMYCETSTFQVCQLSSKWTMIISKYVCVFSLSVFFLLNNCHVFSTSNCLQSFCISLIIAIFDMMLIIALDKMFLSTSQSLGKYSSKFEFKFCF